MRIKEFVDDYSFRGEKRLGILVSADDGDEFDHHAIFERFIRDGSYKGVVFIGVSFGYDKLITGQMAGLCVLVNENGFDVWANTKFSIESIADSDGWTWYLAANVNCMVVNQDHIWMKKLDGRVFQWKEENSERCVTQRILYTQSFPVYIYPRKS